TSTQPRASAMKKIKNERGLKSSRSNSTSSLWSLTRISSVMYRFQNFYCKNVIGRNKWHRTQVTEKVRQPHPADGNRDYHIQPGEAQGLGKIGLDDPEQIYIAHDHEPYCQPNQPSDVALERA